MSHATDPAAVPASAMLPALLGALLAGGCLVLAGRSTGAETPTHPAATPVVLHTAAECADLIKQYDVAAPAHHGAARADDAARERSAGDQACRAGHYADGVAALRRALHYIGVNPVRISPAPRS